MTTTLADLPLSGTVLGDERLPARFWAKVQPDESRCWLWTAALIKGYGSFRIGARPNQKTVLAHRHAYEALIGLVRARLASVAT